MPTQWKSVQDFIKLNNDLGLLKGDVLSPLTIYFIMREIMPKVSYVTVDMPNVPMSQRVSALVETLSSEAADLSISSMTDAESDVFDNAFTEALHKLYYFGATESTTREWPYKVIAYATCLAVFTHDKENPEFRRLAEHNNALKTVHTRRRSRTDHHVPPKNVVDLPKLCTVLAVHTLVLLACDPKNDELIKLTE